VRAGGPEIQEQSRMFIAQVGKIPVGNIAVTGAGTLPCKEIIHAVGPQWVTMDRERSIEKLQTAITNILNYVCGNMHIKTVAIPAVSSGIYQFPLNLCTQTILETICYYFQKKLIVTNLKEIHLVSNEDPTVAAFKAASEAILGMNELGPWKSQKTTSPSSMTLQIAEGLTLQIVQGHIELQKVNLFLFSLPREILELLMTH
jgi:O-acetyl-ADP-ribose deacetylase (regulator of RNase III)